VVDDFTGDGSTTTYTLSTTPSSIDATTVNYNGAILLRNSYSISVANIIFSSPPEAGSEIEVTTITGGVSVGGTPPGGSNTQVQFNDTGSFGGSAAFTFNKTSNVLSVTGNTISGNLLTGGLISAVGNITGAYILGNGSQLTGLPATYGNANVVANLAALGSNPVSTTGNITGGNLRTVGLITATGNITSAANILGDNILTGGLISATGRVFVGNGAAATPGITFAGDTSQDTGFYLRNDGEIGIAVNASMRAYIDPTGIYANGIVSASGNVVSGGNILTPGAMSSTGNAIHGNILTGGLVSATANVTANNGMFTNIVNVANHTGTTVSVTGNVTANNFNGNGSFLSNTKPQLFMITAVSDESTPITTGVAKVIFRAPYAMTLYQIPRASLSVASTSGNPTVDINKNGNSIFSTLLTIDANETTSVTAATPAVLSTTTLADDDQISIDIDVAGTGATGLKVTLYYTRT
jgi:hypothetical protein